VLALSSQPLAKPFTAKDAKDTKEKRILQFFSSFAIFAAFAVKLLLSADC
jgi:hypothetical protein